MSEGTTTAVLPGYYNNARPEVVELVPAAGARILDIGCGAGRMGLELKARGAREVVGVEIAPLAAQVARGRLDAVHALDVQTADLPYPPGHFDVITFADVLEHLVDPLAALRRLRPYLRDDGTIVCSIPNVRHESVVLPLLVNGHFHYEDSGLLDRTHLRFFTIQEIGHLLREAGFKARDVKTVRSEPSRYLDAAAALVGQLGGDVARFRFEATVLQYLIVAGPAEAQAAG